MLQYGPTSSRLLASLKDFDLLKDTFLHKGVDGNGAGWSASYHGYAFDGTHTMFSGTTV